MKFTTEILHEKLAANPDLARRNPELNPNRCLGAVAEPECPVRDGAVRPPPTEKENPSLYKVSVISFRKRLIDPDNLIAKYHIDAIRYEGLIPDDSAKHIVLEVRQEKVHTKGIERTEITIERLP